MEKNGEVDTRSEEELVKRLVRHPAMKARIERVLDVLENTTGDLSRADDAERRAIDELRAMGQEVLQGWGDGQARKGARNLEAGGGVVRQAKKNCTGSAPSAKLG